MNIFKVVYSSYKAACMRYKLLGYVGAFKQQAEQGEAESQAILGAMYFNGVGVRRNVQEAFRWFSEAADQGHLNAQVIIGTWHISGIETNRNSSEAFRWYFEAAGKNHPQAQAALGIMYAYGIGVPMNAIVACAWFDLALAGGYSRIRKVRDVLQSCMSNDQIEHVAKITHFLWGDSNVSRTPPRSNC